MGRHGGVRRRAHARAAWQPVATALAARSRLGDGTPAHPFDLGRRPPRGIHPRPRYVRRVAAPARGRQRVTVDDGPAADAVLGGHDAGDLTQRDDGRVCRRRQGVGRRDSRWAGPRDRRWRKPCVARRRPAGRRRRAGDAQPARRRLARRSVAATAGALLARARHERRSRLVRWSHPTGAPSRFASARIPT